MSDYKLVPVEPTQDMEQAAENYWNDRRFKGLSDDPRTWAGVYQAMLAAAPEVAKLVETLERLVFAAQCRDNSTGCQIRLIETRAELSAAVNNAKEALSAYRQQQENQHDY